MRLTSLFTALFLFVASSFSQVQQIAVNSAPAPEGYGVEVEVVNDNIGITAGAAGAVDLTGYSTYRLYIVTNNADDFVSSISGDSTNPTYVNTTTSFWHDVATGSSTGGGIQGFLLGLFPALGFDSWVTIGLESTPNAALGEAAISTVGSDSNPWLTNFDPLGGNIAIDDGIGGAWYALNGDANGFAGDDLKVLVGQFTTDGELSGQLYAQVFINGDGGNEFRDTFYFGANAPTPGCTDGTACNYDENASEDDGSCTYPEATNLDCDGNCLNDADGDEVCDEDEVGGCTEELACNYDADATDDDGSCTYPPAANLDCAGNCLNDADGDEICDEDEIDGCTDSEACNYSGAATDDDGSCNYPDGYPSNIVDCDGACLNDADGDEVCDENEIGGCQDSGACNYDASATDDDGSCEYTTCAGCTSAAACNYDAAATINDGSCAFADGACETCNPDGTVNPNDDDGDGVCNADETEGCTDPTACNAGDYSDTDNSLCEYAVDVNNGITNLDCDGNCYNDADGDGVCDEDEIGGCTDASACDYDADATDDDGSCTYPVDIYGLDYVDCDGGCLNDADDDGICNEDETDACTNPEACNYNADPTVDTDNSLCVFPYDDVNPGLCSAIENPCNTTPADLLDCDCDCLNDSDGDGICDESEISGCTDAGANNYDACATDDDGSCTGCTNPIADNYYAGADVDDNSCIISGCTDAEACNYFDQANTEDGSCQYPIDLYGVDYVDCNDDCLNDLDGDELCNEEEALTSEGGAIEVAIAAGAAIDSSAALLGSTLDGPSGATCGSVFLPVDAAWDAAGYNLNTLPAEILAELMEGHFFPGICGPMEDGASYTNSLGEDFTYSAASMSLMNEDGDAFAIIDGGFLFGSNSYLYSIGSVIPLDSADPCLGCAGLDMDGAIADYTVECESDLLAATAAAATAYACSELELDAVHSDKFRFDGRNQIETGGGSSQTWNVLTAGDDETFNNGTDALLQFYDIDGDMGQAVYFVEDLSAGGVTLTQYENGTAILEGAVVDMDDASRGLDIHFYFQGRTSGGAWAGGFKNDYGCSVNTDDWTMYVLNDDMSFATGRGDWQFGTLLRFNHQPASQYFGYQLGDGANNHNCDDNGFSGWFNWSGAIAGEAAFGQAGDIIATLDPTVGQPTDCQDGEFVEFHYVAFDEICNIAQLNVQSVTRDDNTAPTYVSGGVDITLDCAESDQWLLDNPASAEVVLFSDNCDDSEYGCAAGFDPNTAGFADGDDVFVCVELVGETTTQYTASSCRTLNRTWVATDCFGNQTYHTQVITIEDNTDPVASVTAPADITLNVNGLCYVDLDPSNTGEGMPSYSDNCDLADTGMSYSDAIVDSTSAGCYSIIRTWSVMATDSCGNSDASSADQRIDIQDLIAPSFSYAPVDTIECNLWIDGACDYSYLNSIGLATATDNCEMNYVDVQCTPLSSACTDDYIIDYTAYDMCGNSTSIQQIVVTSDLTAPEFTFAPADLTLECSDASLTGDVDGYAVPEYTPGDGLHAEAMDNCDADITVTYSDVILTSACDQEYVIRRTYSVYDCDENLNQHIQDITIDDSTAPEFTSFPADVVDVECDMVPGVEALVNLAASDNCDGGPSIAYDGEVRTDGPCEDTYTLERSWTTTDCAGNSHTQTQTITVVDTQGPELTIACPADLTYENECFLGTASAPADEEEEEEANPVVFTYYLDSWTGSESSAIISDADGNEIANYGIGYFTGGLLNESLVLEPGDYTITLFDTYGDGWTTGGVVLSGAAEGTLAFGDGNEASLAFTVEAPGAEEEEEEEEVAGVLVTLTFNADGYASEGSASLFDSEGNVVETFGGFANYTQSIHDLTLAPGQYSITLEDSYGDGWGWNAAGGAGALVLSGAASGSLDFPTGNSATLEFEVSSAALDQVSTDRNGEPTWSVSDNCDGAPEVSYTYSDHVVADCVDGDSAPEGSYTVTRTFTVTAVDNCGNETVQTCVQTITFTDTESPVMSDDTAELYPAAIACSEMGDPNDVTFMPVSATDNCDSELTMEVANSYLTSGSCPGTWVRHWVAYDDCGNMSAEAIQYVPTADTLAPEISITCPGIPGGDGTPVEVTFTYTTDQYASSEGSVIITDSEGAEVVNYPAGSLPGSASTDDVLTLSPGEYTITLSDSYGDGWSWASVSGENALVISGGAEGSLDFSDGGAVSLVFTVVSGGGLTTTVYLDENCDVDLSPEALGFATAEYSDDCDTDPALEITYADGPRDYACGEETGTFTFTRTWTSTVTDQCGNSSSDQCDQIITAIDDSAPSLDLDCPVGANLVNVCFSDVDTSIEALGEVQWTALDNCDENLDVSYTYSDVIEFDCSLVGVDDNPEGSYNFTRTFVVTAIDCNGNTTIESCTQTINTFDIEAPVIDLTCPATATVQHDENCEADLDPSITGSAFATATDNCDTDVTISYSYADGEPSYTCGNGGYELIRTWTATAEDDCGNSSSTTCEQTIVVEDNIDPVASIECPADATVSLDANCEADLSTDALGMASGSGTDNCDEDVDIEITYEDGAPTYSCDGDDDQLDGSYSFTRTFTSTATDDCGNSHSVTCDQLITVNDEIAPTQIFPNLPTDTLYLDLDCAVDLAPAASPAPETTDNCDSDVTAVVTYEDNAASFASLFGELTVEVETVAEHSEGELAGMSTYRVYAVLPQEGDFLSSISGEGSFSTQIRTSTSFFQHNLGGHVPNGLNPFIFGQFPELEYDSYVTIGLSQSPDVLAGEANINVAGADWTTNFESGGDVVLNGQFGGAWFALAGDANAYAGADRRVLVAQLTTDGAINGQIFAQVFPQGDGGSAQLFTATIGDGCEGDDATIEGSYVVSRLWTSTVSDDCGNEDTAHAYQYIVVLDTIPPQFTNTCDIENGETVEYTCADDNGNGVNDIFDFTEIPAPCAPEYIENCDSEVALTMTSVESGYVPNGDIANYCMPSTVEAIANGETCDDRNPEAIRLFNFGGDESYTIVSGGSSIVEILQDSTMHIVLETQNAAGDAGFIFDAIYDGGHDWNEWLALPGMHNYKKDCAEIFPGLEIWTEWIYYTMSSGTMSGTGRYAGSEFSLSHQPLNEYYGLQVGEGANNKNESYGASAWFFWTGEYVLDGASQGAMASSGDIFFDLDCCLGWQIDYDYTVVDDCGNSNGFSYSDMGTGEFGNSANSTVSGHTPIDITSGASSLKDPIRITGLQPNPTNDISTLGFVVSSNMRLRIDLYTMGGGYVGELFDGNASEDVQYMLDIDATTLSSGMYQIRMSSNDYVLVKKLLVSE